MANIPKVKFSNGQEFPIFGLGTWKSKPGEVAIAVRHALDIGYRHIDCAHIYQNEKEVGDALQQAFKDGVVTRSDIYITSKLWNTFHRPDLVEGAIKTTLKNLQLDYLDLYLIHWPTAYKEDCELFPVDAAGNVQFSDIDYLDTWKALESVCEKGLTKSIGVSNFNSKQIDRVLGIAKIKPVVNQVECHPYLNQKKLMDFCKSKNIVITAYSPLGSPDRPWAKPEDPKLLDDPKIEAIAKKYGKSTAQIVIKYNVQRGNITIPKSITPARIEENLNIFDFELNKSDMETIDSFDCNGRIVPLDNAKKHPHYPFNELF